MLKFEGKDCLDLKGLEVLFMNLVFFLFKFYFEEDIFNFFYNGNKN